MGQFGNITKILGVVGGPGGGGNSEREG